MKYIGSIDSEDEIVYVCQDRNDIYICRDSHLDFPLNLGYNDADKSLADYVEDMEVGDKVELTGWYLVLSKNEFKQIVKIFSTKS